MDDLIDTTSKAGECHRRPVRSLKNRLRNGLIILGLIAVVALIGADSLTRLALIRKASAMRLMETTTQVNAPGTRQRNLIIPTSGTDGKWWIIYAEQMVKTGQWRVRHTDMDNSPKGREVHWSSGLMWLLVAMSWAMHLVSGLPQMDCVAWAAVWMPPFSLLLALFGFGLMLARRYGYFVASCGVIIFGTCAPLAVHYQLGDCYHHGLVGWLAMASLLCLAAGGGGCVAQGGDRKEMCDYRSARKWFIASGILGAAGLWISAATEIPILVGTGAGALVAGILAIRLGAAVNSRLWQDWGVAGCLTSLGFYLLEYFPSSMGWRLEVNHPVHSFAWLGGGYLIHRIVNSRLPRTESVNNWQYHGLLVGSIICLLLPAALIVSHPEKYFWVADRFLLALHNNYILEFQPFFDRTEDSDAVTSIIQVFTLPVLCCVAIVYLLFSNRLSAKWFAPMLVALFPALVMFALGMREVRWLGIAMELWVLLATLLVAFYFQEKRNLNLPRWVPITFLTLVAGSSLIFPFLVLRNYVQGQLFPEKIARSILPNVVARDVVHRLIQIDSPVILSGPTTSTELTYYGGVKTIGTLYWENREGLKTAARVFSAESSDKARQLLMQHGITHILVFSWDDFSGDYQLLLQKYLEGGSGKWQDMFITRLLQGKEIPQWIRPLYYPIPKSFELPQENVALFAVVPQQSRLEWAANLGTFYLDAGRNEDAVRAFADALSEDPTNPGVTTQFALANILSGRFKEAALAIEKAPIEAQVGLRKQLEIALSATAKPQPPKP